MVGCISQFLPISALSIAVESCTYLPTFLVSDLHGMLYVIELTALCSLGRPVEEVGQAGISWSGQCWEDDPLEYAERRQNGTTCAHTASKYVGHIVYSDV